MLIGAMPWKEMKWTKTPADLDEKHENWDGENGKPDHRTDRLS